MSERLVCRTVGCTSVFARWWTWPHALIRRREPRRMSDERVAKAAERLLNEVALHRAMALPSEGESFTDDVELVARTVESLEKENERLREHLRSRHDCNFPGDDEPSVWQALEPQGGE